MRARMILAAALAALAVVATAAASAGQRYADPRDDAGTAPDITDVSVTSDDTGLITFRIAVANRAALEADDELDVGLDADRQLATGQDGLDYVVGVYRGSEPFVMAWSDEVEDWVGVAAPTYRFDWSDGTATYTINRSDLGWTSGFEFLAVGWDTSADEPSDYAPATDDRWPYALALPFALRLAPLQGLDLTGAPKAGASFTLAAHVVREDTGATLHSGRIACSATAGGKRLAQSSKARFFRVTVSDGSGDFTQALCDWKVPKTAKGKTLRATLTVSLAGKAVTRTFTGKVR